MAMLPIIGRLFEEDDTCYLVFDHRTDNEVGRFYPRHPWLVELAPDGRMAINARQDGQLEFWDIPPRKPLTWFALAAAVLALPLAGLAWRRSRRLRREAA
jgi:hypothetical protein